jgi:hypothetical protein
VFESVDTRDSSQVERQVNELYLDFCSDGRPGFVPQAFAWVRQCFAGYGDYQAIDARYHDLEHTLQGTLCLARLLHRRRRAGAAPAFSREWFELSLLAILFHDTGYLKKRDDTQGTGAKYTPIHVHRSAEFAAWFLAERGYAGQDIKAIQNMIRCTGVNADVERIPFRSEVEQIAGLALATSDLLGQMAAADYVEKLALLYEEFAEAARFDPQRGARLAIHRCAADLIRGTPGFWRDYAWPRLNNQYRKLYLYLHDPYPDGPNFYLERIEANLAKLRTLP